MCQPSSLKQQKQGVVFEQPSLLSVPVFFLYFTDALTVSASASASALASRKSAKHHTLYLIANHNTFGPRSHGNSIILYFIALKNGDGLHSYMNKSAFMLSPSFTTSLIIVYLFCIRIFNNSNILLICA